MSPSIHKIFLIVALWLTVSVPSTQALVIDTYIPSRHDRFSGFPAAPVHNPSFMYAGLNLTGVGWDTSNPSRQLTMVSPRHFLGAYHYKPAIGATIRFLSSGGTVRNYTVASITPITHDTGQNSDLFIGTLSNSIAPGDGIDFHPYLNLRREQNYLRKTLVMLGKTARGGSQTVDSITSIMIPGKINTTKALTSYSSFSSAGPDDAYFESGDSGSPSFIVNNNIAAIVGTHSAVASGSSSATNYDAFVPYYADKLNTIMEAHGYHMTKAIPGTTTLTLNHQILPDILRAGHPITIDLTIYNTGSIPGENIKLISLSPTGKSVSSTADAGWFDESSATVTRVRRAELTPSSATTHSINLTIPEPGTASHQVTYSCDQSSPTIENFSIDVIESFISWGNDLTNKNTTGDDDTDHISNLLEYAFGGDPAVPSQYHPGTSIHLLPTFAKSGGTYNISHIRRTDHITRALSYQLTSSTSLKNGSWNDASSAISHRTITPINTDFELVTLHLSTSGTEEFYRIKVTLDE